MSYLIGIIVTLALTVFYFFTKNQSAQSLIKSLTSNKDLNPKIADIALNQSLDNSETKKQVQLNEQLKKEQNTEASQQELLDFLNNIPK